MSPTRCETRQAVNGFYISATVKLMERILPVGTIYLVILVTSHLHLYNQCENLQNFDIQLAFEPATSGNVCICVHAFSYLSECNTI